MPLQQTSFAVYDPFSKAMPSPKHLANYKLVIAEVESLIAKLFAERKGNLHICAILRTDETQHAWLNLTMALPNLGVRRELLQAPEYAGAMGHAEQLLDGMFRVATPEEEAVCRKRDFDARETKLAARENVKRRDNQAAGRAMAEAFSETLAAARQENKPGLAGKK